MANGTSGNDYSSQLWAPPYPVPFQVNEILLFSSSILPFRFLGGSWPGKFK